MDAAPLVLVVVRKATPLRVPMESGVHDDRGPLQRGCLRSMLAADKAFQQRLLHDVNTN